ncbi:MAG: ferrous iron transport protein A [Clostridiales Family XIII bacterium]|jgi:ferrous iron transport protein A|nr:ferrous iron transport protein A [Clostridiales Family XIII bacterium]
MMPLSMCNTGHETKVQKISGKDKIKTHLHNLGIAPGADLCVVSKSGDNMIVSVRDTRIALTKDLTSRIMCV